MDTDSDGPPYTSEIGEVPRHMHWARQENERPHIKAALRCEHRDVSAMAMGDQVQAIQPVLSYPSKQIDSTARSRRVAVPTRPRESVGP
ncbi:MAG: hypothetical protein NVS2B16_27240 [Chloroflexota bacterium]